MTIISNTCPIDLSNKNLIDYAKTESFKYNLLIAAKAGKSVYENYYNQLNNLPYARELNGKYSLQKIFRDNWDDFCRIQNEKGKPIRESILINIDKMIHCKDFSEGYIFYECPKCNNYYIQGLSCHSRFCPSCGKKYRDARALEIAKTCIRVPHRHITWTIPDTLRPFFARHKDMYDLLFEAVNEVLTYIVQGKSKSARKRRKQLGFISTIHTFGRDLKYNPHIHTLVTECSIDKNGLKEKFDYFNYKTLRTAFMLVLTKKIYRFLIDNSFKDEAKDFYNIKTELYKSKGEGFYVHAPQKNITNQKKIKDLVQYICRYVGHPAMSEARILNYDKNKKTISYYYDPHEDDTITNENDKIGRQFVTETVYEFIAKLIIHIPESKTHTTRYYGFYANHSSIDISKQYKLYNTFELKYMEKNLSWRKKLFQSYKYDPLICHCGATMVICQELCYFKGYIKEDG